MSVDEAFSIIGASVTPSAVESVRVEEALGRVLARGLESAVDWPPFDTSAMDGYAVRISDAVPGRVVPERTGLVAAGAGPPPPLIRGEAVRVMTGAPLPDGTEAIVPVERARRTPDGVAFDEAPRVAAHIRRRGESVRRGAPLLSAGHRLGPLDVGLAALAGADSLPVHRAPRIGLATTGDEVVRSARDLTPGRFHDSNGPMLLAACRAGGWTAARLPPVPDSPSAVERLFAAAGDSEDVLITTGGVSAGDLDLLPAAAADSGFEILFHGVSIRPGKPIAFARRGGVFWIGLPGNPVSASVGFLLFAREILGRFEGDSAPGLPRVRARLGASARRAGARETYLDGTWTCGAGGSTVFPVASSGSHDLAAHARANALIRLPPGGPEPSEGTEVECLLRPDPLAVPE